MLFSIAELDLVYRIQPETPLANEYDITDSNFSNFTTLHNKNRRIRMALDSIRNNYLSRNRMANQEPLIEPQSINKNPVNIEVPATCRGDGHKKGSCYDKCNEICNYNIREIDDPTRKLSVNEVKSELLKHSHPQYRIDNVTKKAQTADLMRKELINHYRYAHPI